jgi:hypothetical protein
MGYLSERRIDMASHVEHEHGHGGGHASSARALPGAHDHHGERGSLNRVAALATLHCLTGCAIGEVLGMVIGTALGWEAIPTLVLAIVLAFTFGYALTMVPLLRAGLALGVALPLAFASDSLSIAVMEIVDNGIMLTVPGAMDATLGNALFWGALALALAVAFVVAFPVNRALIARGRGHAVVHGAHGGGAVEVPARRLGLVALGAGSVAVTIATVVLAALALE